MVTTATQFQYGFWLAFDNRGKVRLTVREPDISRTERKMFVQAALPKSLWVSPALRATITVREDDHEPKFEIDLQAAADALRGSLGVDIDMQIVPTTPEELDAIEEQITEMLKDPAP